MKNSAVCRNMGQTSKKEQEASQAWRSALAQILAVSVKNFVLLGYGMTLGFPTLLIPVLAKNHQEEPFSLGEEGLSWIGSIGLICVPFGCFVSGMITQPLGRRRAMQLINIPFVAAWMIFYFSSEIWHIFVALAITGLGGGLMEAPVLTYVAEITQPNLRGILSSTSSMSVIGGQMIQFVLATFLKWRTVALVSAFMPVASFSLLFLIPETPIWLISKKRYAEAKQSLAWLRGWVSVEDVDEEYKELFKQVQVSRGIGNEGFQEENGIVDGPKTDTNEEKDGNNSEARKRTKLETLKLFKKRNFVIPYLLVSYTFFLSHFNGLSPVQTYAVSIFSSFKAPIDKYHATALLGIVEVLGCITCVSLVHYSGKRILAFVSLIGTALCFLVVGSYAHIFHITSLMESNSSISNITSIEGVDHESSSWLPMIILILAAFLSHMGIRVLPWILTGEFFPNEIRAIASGIAATSFYIFGFVCNKVFLSMVSNFTLPGTLWFFSSMSFLGFIILYFELPETEGKSLHDITNHFSGKMKLGNNVLRNKKNNYSFNNEGFVNDDRTKSDVESKL